MLFSQHNLPHAHNLNPFFNFMHLEPLAEFEMPSLGNYSYIKIQNSDGY